MRKSLKKKLYTLPFLWYGQKVCGYQWATWRIVGRKRVWTDMFYTVYLMILMGGGFRGILNEVKWTLQMICRKVSIWIHQVTIWTPLGKHGVQFFWLLSGPFLRTFEVVNYIFILQPLIVLFICCLRKIVFVFSCSCFFWYWPGGNRRASSPRADKA